MGFGLAKHKKKSSAEQTQANQPAARTWTVWCGVSCTPHPRTSKVRQSFRKRTKNVAVAATRGPSILVMRSLKAARINRRFAMPCAKASICRQQTRIHSSKRNIAFPRQHFFFGIEFLNVGPETRRKELKQQKGLKLAAKFCLQFCQDRGRKSLQKNQVTRNKRKRIVQDACSQLTRVSTYLA